MQGKLIIISGFIFIITAFSFFTKKRIGPADEVKVYYLQQAKQFEADIASLQALVAAGNEKQLQQQFIKARLAYKKIETVVEYYFNFFAVKINGPAIPFFEEDEPDMGQQQPAGMQLIEGMIFPVFNKSAVRSLDSALTMLLIDTRAMQATNESNAFDDELIFDAVTEELFRITALGITGFDSQSAVNSLPECSAAIDGVEKILLLYRDSLARLPVEKNRQLWNLLSGAKLYLDQHKDFNSFNRMQFIQDYLDPVTQIVGAYKRVKGYGENRSPMFYSIIKKNNGLFAKDIFDGNKYLDDNTTSADKIILGRRLFFDKQLSADNKRSCATCHNPAKAFTDGLPTSTAIDGHTALPRNAPTLWNAALQRNLFLDNRSFSLEDQVMEVLNNASEMHGSAASAAANIIIQKGYDSLYAKAYPGTDKTAAAQNICNAIACYERTLIALNSKFDKHMRGQPVLNKNEISGFNLFMGKAKCGTCHFMPLFSGAKPPRYYYTETEVIGVPAADITTTKLDKDEGRFIVTGLPIHKYAFKTGSLRNIALTAPYMHNGVFKTLEQVLDFYNNGGGKGLKIAPKNQTLPFEKLGLSATEKSCIIAFLKTLTDTTPSPETPVHSSL
jgi:cytochrome c peroxidase